MNKKFIYSEPRIISNASNEKSITYCIPNDYEEIIKHKHIALVDDVINAGSSIIATMNELLKYQSYIEVVGTPLAIGSFYDRMILNNEIPIKALKRMKTNIWPPRECPLCKAGQPIDNE
jgi:orotate phosphoribosyltransferase